MLNPQVIMNLLPKLRIGVDLTRRSRWVGKRFMCRPSASALRSETNEFHKRLSVLGCLLQTRVERGANFMGCFKKQPHSRCLKLQVNLEIALSGASAKVKPLDRFRRAKVRWDVG